VDRLCECQIGGARVGSVVRVVDLRCEWWIGGASVGLKVQALIRGYGASFATP
jgi:hypothetical protein